MSGISSGIGLVSGINSRDIIDQLMTLEARPKTRLQGRIDRANEQRIAYTSLSTKLTGMRLSATVLKKPSTFTGAQANSSNEDVVTASASNGAAVGSYQVRVARLVTSQQLLSRGFGDFDTAKVGAGTITVEMGGGELNSPNNLNDLNGGAGVSRGVFRITDRSGATAIIDTSDAVTLDDVVKRINNSLSINVRAAIDGDKLVLSDLTGATTANLTVQDLGETQAASSLGIAGSVATTTLTGTQINTIGNGTALSLLNDGRGVRTASTGADFTLTFRDGTTAGVSLGNTRSLGDVMQRIREAGGGSKINATVAPDGKSLVLTDLTGGGGTLTVAAVGTSKAAADLGILGSGTGATLTGTQVVSSLGTVNLSALKGGAGLTLGTISVTNRAGANNNIDLSGAKTVADVIRLINTAGAGVTASLNGAANGIALTDTTGGAGNLVIADSGTPASATDLGLAGTFGLDRTTVNGANLQRQWISENTLLSTYNGGKGVRPGVFRITDGNGLSRNIRVDAGDVRLADVITKINTSGLAVNARINDNGDGLLVTTTAGVATALKIEDANGSAAADLNILGTASATGINGSFEKTIDVTAADTLATLQTKINNLNFGVGASIVNDGSAAAPFRLSLSTRNAGTAGRVTLDAGTTSLGTQNLVDAQDAAVFVGGGDGRQSMLISAPRNTISGAIRGVTLELTGTSSQPVTVNVGRSVENVVAEVEKFVENFNTLRAEIKELTKFDPTTGARGLLLGSSAVQTIENQLFASLQTVVSDNGRYRVLGDVGITIQDGELTFDEEKFQTAWADDPDAVSRLFSRAGSVIDDETPLAILNAGRGVRTNDLGADLRVTVKDGTAFDIDLSSATSMGDVVRLINDAAGTAFSVRLNTLGTGLILTDNSTTGTSPFKIEAINGSPAAIDLGISGVGSNGTLTGRNIPTNRTADLGGVGAAIESRINRLIDPVNGVVSRQNRDIDTQTQQFQSRINSLDKLLEAKRGRLERQFAQLESTLASLQSQQSAIGQIQNIQPIQRRNN